MKVAFVYPHSSIPAPPAGLGDAMTLVNFELSRHLARHCEMLVYPGHVRGQPRQNEFGGVGFRRTPVVADRLLGQLKHLDGVVWRDPRRPFRTTSLYYPIFARRVARDTARERCDIVHVHAVPNFLPMIRSRNPRAKLVFHSHDHLVNDFDRTAMLRYLRHADLILACSRHVSDRTRARFPELATRCDYLHNGADLARLAPADRSARRAGRGCRLLFVGRLSPEKGLHVLLEAFREVVASGADASLEIIGPSSFSPKQFVDPFDQDPVLRGLEGYFQRTGSYLPGLRRQIAAGLDGRVTLAGPVPNSELAPRYAAADIFVFPSLWHEPFGMPLAEAMAAGLPVVASDGGAFPEIVENGRTGILVPRGDASALAAALERLIADRALRLQFGAAGLQRARQYFSWDYAANRLLGMYRRLLAAG